MASHPHVRVLYVLGVYHSGTTILGNMLGQLDGFLHVGELRALWPKLTLPGYRCGCGEGLLDCPVWNKVLSAELGEGDVLAERARELWHLQRQVLGDHHTWRLVPALLRRRREGLRPDSPAARYARALAGVYRRAAEVTGAQVIVDSSKEPTDAALLLTMPDVDVSIAQIVRDPRGLVYSVLRFQARGERIDGSRWRQSAYAALSWSAGNLAGATVRRAAGPGRSALLRYEDFVARPRETIESLAGLAGWPARLPDPGPGADPGTVVLRPTHTVGGNNNRFRTGPVRLSEDVQWRSGLHRIDRAAVTALCLPLMARYGYRPAR